MTPKLYELADDYVAFSEKLEATDNPESEPELETALAEIHGNFLAKTDNVLALIEEFENHAESVERNIERQQGRAKASRHKAAWLRQYMLAQMQRIGQEHVRTSRFSAHITHTKAVEITDEVVIPAGFVKQIVTYKPDKTAIRNAIEKNGEEVPGAVLVEREHLRIT